MSYLYILFSLQDWFTDCAEHITRVSGEPLEWVTPLGLPVIQPYHKEITLKSGKFNMLVFLCYFLSNIVLLHFLRKRIVFHYINIYFLVFLGKGVMFKLY